jgi:hypothetical protein
MTAPVLQIVWLHRRVFAGVMSLVFLVLIGVIFAVIKPHAAVQSSFEIGSFELKGKREPIAAPDTVAKTAVGAYLPFALSTMEAKGTSHSTLNSLRTLNAESFGYTVVLSNTVALGAETQAQEFQQIIADQVINDLAGRSQALRNRALDRITQTTKNLLLLDQEINLEGGEIRRLGTLSETLESQIENQREKLAALYQRSTTQQGDERSAIETQIRESREQIASAAKIMNSLAGDRSRLAQGLAASNREREKQAEVLGDAQHDQKSLTDTRLLLAPYAITVSSASRRLNFIFVALMISALIAFGIVTLIHNATDFRP